ncbi:hypothetical protein OIO90_005466 [Microbotryomycetes sp. JL221]|nr:hypothetical protein OIO90_005466 [Microbotryomycetes sp. JL221]
MVSLTDDDALTKRPNRVDRSSATWFNLRSRTDLKRRTATRVAVLTALTYLFWHLWTTWHGHRRNESSDVRVCLIGNAETRHKAINVYLQWHKSFPSAFYVWGKSNDGQEQSDDSEHGKSYDIDKNLILLRPDSNKGKPLPFTDGLYEALQAVTTMHSCDYIFTHDDDLTFRTSAQATYSRPDLELVHLLSKYQPAVAGFPWDVGDDRFETMKRLKQKWQHNEVAPLTGFDNGMVVYHHSVLELFFPMSPQGEGGFTGKWTLGAHFLQMFAPLVFRQHAIRLNTLPYDNMINMDNVPKDASGGVGAVIKEDGLAYVPASRHPYEYPMNEAYQTFLKSGLKRRGQRWGRNLDVDDVDQPQIWFDKRGYNAEWIVERLDEFFDVRHESLSRTRFIKNLGVDRLESILDDVEIRRQHHQDVQNRA